MSHGNVVSIFSRAKGSCEPIEKWLQCRNSEEEVAAIVARLMLRSKMQTLSHNLPHVVEALHRFASLVTPCFPGSRFPLLHEIVGRVIDVHHHCVQSELEDPELETLREIACAADLVRAVQIVGMSSADRQCVWTIQEPLPIWANEQKVEQLMVIRTPSNRSASVSCRVHLLSHLVTPKVLSRHLSNDQRLRWATL